MPVTKKFFLLRNFSKLEPINPLAPVTKIFFYKLPMIFLNLVIEFTA